MLNPFENISYEEITARVLNLEEPTPGEQYRRMIGYLDLTSLHNTDNENNITGLVEKVNNYSFLFPDLPNVAGICVYPRQIPVVKEKLTIDSVRIASVGASFPDSQTFTEIKIEECKKIIDAGADEIDIVINIGDFLAGKYDVVSAEIKKIKETIGCKHLKVIIESGILHEPSKIYKASMLAMEAGADFIKTSTGKTALSASHEAAWVMCTAIKDYYDASGREVGFKPAGGIATAADALIYHSVLEHILGRQWLVPDLFRIGASRLANSLLTGVEGRTVDYF